MVEFSGRIGHLTDIESPWGNAGGVVKTVEDAERMAQTGVGWIEPGSYTLEKRYGNKRDKGTGELIIDPRTREPLVDYYHDPVTGKTYNSIGMNNPGESAFDDEIPEMVQIAEARGKKLIANVAPVSGDPEAETRELVQRAFEAKAHGVLVNGGCPNVIIEGEQRHEILSRNAEMTFLVLAGLKDVVEKYHKVFFRVTPQATAEEADSLYQSVIRAGTVSAVWTPNTWPGHKPMKDGAPALTIEGNVGGKSGPAMAEAAAEQVAWAVNSLRGYGIDVVASSGIANSEALRVDAAAQLKRCMDLGAVAGSGTTFYFESEDGWTEDTDRLLHKLAA